MAFNCFRSHAHPPTPPPRSESEVVDVYFEDVLQVCPTSAKTVCCPLEIQDQQVAPKAVLPSSIPTLFSDLHNATDDILYYILLPPGQI